MKSNFFHSNIIFRVEQLMSTLSSRSKLASITSSAPLQVHRGGGNPLNIVSLHCLTIFLSADTPCPSDNHFISFVPAGPCLVQGRGRRELSKQPLADLKVFELQEVLDFIQARGEPDYS